MCNCIDALREVLTLRNTGISCTAGGRPIMETFKLRQREKGKAAVVVPSYCPFCGEKYESAATGKNQIEMKL